MQALGDTKLHSEVVFLSEERKSLTGDAHYQNLVQINLGKEHLQLVQWMKIPDYKSSFLEAPPKYVLQASELCGKKELAANVAH